MLSKPIEVDTSENLERVKHPLLASVDYPIGYSDLYFKKYSHVFRTTLNNIYSEWLKLSEIGGVHSGGFLIRFPFYIQGPANAYVSLSPIEHPSLEDDAYEFVIGGLNNTRVEIRKRINGVTLVDERKTNVLSVWGKKKFVIEVSTKGELKLYSEDNPYRPMAIAFDPKPLDVKYVSFKNHNSETLDFFYGIPLHLDHSVIVADSLAAEQKPLSVHPLLRQWNNNDFKIDVKTLALHSKYYEAHKSIVEFMPINTKYIQKGYVLRMPVYLLGSSEAVITLANVKLPTLKDKVYKIVIGAKDNMLSSIYIGDVVKARAYEQKLLSFGEPIKVVLEITNDGCINVFTSHNPYKPLISYSDTNLIDVKYVSYWSPYSLQVFYDSDLRTEPFVPLDVLQMEVVKHPLLIAQDYPIGLADTCK